jgi:hypothetical protein
MGHMVYRSSHGDPDSLLKPATYVSGREYCEILFMYTAHYLAIGPSLKEILSHCKKFFSL